MNLNQMEDLCFEYKRSSVVLVKGGKKQGKLYRCIISDEMSAVETMDKAVQNIWQLCLASLQVIKKEG